MATSNVRVNLTADPSGLERGFKSAARSADVFSRELAKVEAAQQRQGVMMAQATREMESEFARRKQAVRGFSADAGKAMLGLGAAVAVGLGFAAKAAADWESAFAGVRKVVDGSPEQIAGLERELRNLATTLPATATEIAGVAENAGQLGVARKDIASFTSTMIALGVSTNLSAEEAATGLAQLGNIMGVLPDQVGRAGASLVALGNAGASTESDILAMGLRIAGAGRQVGLTEAQVLGFANTLSSLGIEAESGGTAISRVFLNIQQAVANGGDQLDRFARVSGQSTTEFAERFRTDAAGAVAEFIGGLGRMSANGENTIGTLGKLGLSEIRVRDTLLRTSGAADQLTASLATGTDAWSENTALLDEASKRYGTATSRIQVARNQINDAAIDIGGTVLPAFAKAAETAGGMAEAFTKLPGPVKDTAAALGVAAAAVGILGGAALIAVPKVGALLETLDSFGGRGAKAAGGLRKSIGAVTGVLGGPWGIALTAATIGLGIWAAKQGEARARVDDLSKALDQQTGAVTEQARAVAYNQLQQDGVIASAREVGLNLGLVTDAALGNAAAQQAITDALREQYAVFLATDAAQRGPARERLDALSKIKVAVQGSTGEYEKARQKVADQAEAMGTTANATDEYTAAQTKAAGAAGLTAQAVSDLSKELTDLNDNTLTSRKNVRDFEAALDAATKAAKDNGKTLDITTEKGRSNQDALDNIAEAALRVAEGILTETGSEEKMRTSLEKSRTKLATAAHQMGLSETAAKKLADSLIRIPEAKTVRITVEGLTKAITEAGRLNEAVARIDGKTITLRVALQNPGLVAAIGQAQHSATGGAISGAGTGTSDSVPAMLSTGEHVWTASEVSMAGGQGAMYRMRAAVRSGALSGYAQGGAVGVAERAVDRAEDDVADARRRVRRARSGKAKDEAQQDLSDARDELRDARDRLARVRDDARELRVDVRRGNIVGSVKSGLDGGYSVIDRLLDQSRNKDLTKGQRRNLAAEAARAEPALRRLWAHAEKIDAALDKARGRLEEMTQLRDQVRGNLAGRFNLSDAVANARSYYDLPGGKVGTRVNVVQIRKSAQAYAGQLKKLAGRLEQLKKLGMPAALLQEIAGLDYEDAIASADAWIQMGAGEIKELAGAYAGIDKYAKRAGTSVADALYDGGIDGAKAIIKGLESEENAILAAVTAIGEAMQKALLDAISGKKGKKGKSAGASSSGSSLLLGSPLTLSVAAGSSAFPAGGLRVVEQHNHYHLDGAVVAATARGYAVEMDTVRRRVETTMSRS